jgi:hypothetical protein
MVNLSGSDPAVRYAAATSISGLQQICGREE